MNMLHRYIIKTLLFPVTLLYGMGVGLIDWFYSIGLLKGIAFNIPVISIGNLSVGGTGKTPHIEWLIRHFRNYLQIGVISRGYGRKTKGYLEVTTDMVARQSGDEPLQFKRKYPETAVAVCESRTFAIPQLLLSHPEIKLILLDDAFQHRSVTPGINILLTQYSVPYTDDYLLPIGRLREWRKGYQRADIIVVTKCPRDLNIEIKKDWERKLKLLPHQQLFFSYYTYGQPYFFLDANVRLNLSERPSLLLVCAIARTDYLLDYLNQVSDDVEVMEFEDHHFFTKYEVSRIENFYRNMEGNNKAIITTEKDAMRLEQHADFLRKNRLPVFILPALVEIHFDEGEELINRIKEFLLAFKV